MYEIGQKLVYGAHGVCTVVGLETRVIDRNSISYYVLQPLEQAESRYLVPCGNAAALAKLRPLMPKQTLLALLQSADYGQDPWVDDENRRKQNYRQLINNLDLESLIRTVHSLRSHKKLLAQQGRKFHQCDDNFLRDAMRLLRTELSLVLELPEAEVDAYL